MSPYIRLKILEKIENEDLTDKELNIIDSILSVDEKLKQEMTLNIEIYRLWLKKVLLYLEID